MKIKLFFFAALAMILASCSNDEGLTPISESLKDTPINVNVLVSNLETRAGNDSETDFDKFYISIKQSEVNDKYNYDNVVMKKEGGQWVSYESDVEGADKKELLWEGTDQVSVTASTFPMTGTVPYALSVAADQSTADRIKESDHLFYKNDAVTSSTDGIKIEFEHIMSKLVISVTLRDEFAGVSDPITSVSVFGTKLQGSYTPGSNTPWTIADNTTAQIIKANKRDEYNASSRIATYEVILLPQTIDPDEGGVFGVNILIDGKNYEWSVDKGVVLTAGTQYNLLLTAGKDKVSNANFSASSWGNGDDINSKTE